MRISAFTIVKNATRFDYPIIESIRSLEPFVDEYVVNLGDSEDDTDALVRAAFGANRKFVIFNSTWEGRDRGMTFFRSQTNLALARCTGDWAFYLQADECVHEAEMAGIREEFQSARAAGRRACLFDYYHFEKNYTKVKKTFREGFDAYEHEVRAFRNDGNVESCGDAMGFVYRDRGADLKAVPAWLHHTKMHIYHYGYVKNPRTMLEKKRYLMEFYFNDPAFTEEQRALEHGKTRSIGDRYRYSRQLNDFAGTHPSAMQKRIAAFNADNPDLLG